jgi:hypothetical protein
MMNGNSVVVVDFVTVSVEGQPAPVESFAEA